MIDDRYDIERLIAAGGMAEVFLALDKRHHRRVAIKMLHAELASTIATERFQREIVTTARLQHPNILSLFDSGEANGRLYYVMPYIQGESLRDRLDRERQLPIDEAQRIAAAMLDALQHAHDQGVVHRDIKPENVLLQGDHVLVADFGVSLALEKAAITRLTHTGVSLGTPQYMSPEQAGGELQITSKTDVYSVGAVLYEMLTGEPPFGGSSATAITSRIISATPHPPRSLRNTITTQLERDILRALAKAPPDRPSARELAKALRGPVNETVAGSLVRSRIATHRLWIPVVAVLSVLVIPFVYSFTRPARENPPPVWLSFTPQTDAPLVTTYGGPLIAISPSGKQLVYVGPSKTSRHSTQLFLRSLDSRIAAPIAGTDSGFGPIFSPDGTSIAFSIPGGKVRRVSLSGGDVVDIKGAAGSAVWSDDGFLIYFNGIGIRKVPDRGGVPQALIVRDSALGNAPFVFSALPGGKGVLFRSCATGKSCRLAIASGATQTVKEFGFEATGAWYLPTGHLAYLRNDGVLLVVPFDLGTLTVRGEPKEVLQNVSTLGRSPQISWSRTGTVAILTEGVRTSQLIIFYPQAQIADVVLEQSGRLDRPDVSPNGQHIALTVSSGATMSSGPLGPFDGNPSSYIGVFDVQSRVLRRMTQEAGATAASWSPSGDLLAYVAGDWRKDRLFVTGHFNGALPSQISVRPYHLLGTGRSGIAWESESRLNLDAFPNANGGNAVRVSVAINGSGPVREVESRASDFNVDGPWELSFRPAGPDWREWHFEVSHRRDGHSPQDNRNRRESVILGNGGAPLWHQSGRELYFRTADSLYVVRLPDQGTKGITRDAYSLVKQFPTPARWPPDFDVFPDGRRFAMIKHGDPVVEIQVALNWFEQVKALFEKK